MQRFSEFEQDGYTIETFVDPPIGNKKKLYTVFYKRGQKNVKTERIKFEFASILDWNDLQILEERIQNTLETLKNTPSRKEKKN